MRTICFAAAAFSLFAAFGPLQALEAANTMASWRAAPSAEKTKLVTELLKRDAREGTAPSVVKCLDAAASVPGHANLLIGQVVKACEKEGGELV